MRQDEDPVNQGRNQETIDGGGIPLHLSEQGADMSHHEENLMCFTD